MLKLNLNMKSFLTIISVLIISIHNGSSKLFEKVPQTEDVDIVYPRNIHNERGLRECPHNAACSILHRRFWYKLRAERLCQCPDFHECPSQWRNESLDNFTMMVNNRAQMKFCDPLDELLPCETSDVALKIISNRTLSPDKYNKHQNIEVVHTHAIANCQCQHPSYWERSNETFINDNVTVSEYKCVELKKCNTNEFCGHIRADYFSSFYLCSCPIRHMCLFQDRNLYNVTELLYKGAAYKGVCKMTRVKLSKGRMRYA